MFEKWKQLFKDWLEQRAEFQYKVYELQHKVSDLEMMVVDLQMQATWAKNALERLIDDYNERASEKTSVPHRGSLAEEVSRPQRRRTDAELRDRRPPSV